MTTDEFDTQMRRWLIENALSDKDQDEVVAGVGLGETYLGILMEWEKRHEREAMQIEKSALLFAWFAAKRNQG